MNIQNWNMQNEYNSPTNQVKRLRDAGLNPSLVYGNGGGSTGNAPQMPAYQQAGTDITANMMTSMQMAQMAANIKKTEAEAKNIDEDTEGKNITNQTLSEMNNAIIDNYLSKTEVNRKEVEYKAKQMEKMDVEMAQLEMSIEVMAEDINMKIAQTDSIREQTKLTQLKKITEIAQRVLLQEQAKTEGVKRVNIGADTDLKVAQAVNQYSQANLADATSFNVNAETFMKECKNLYYREYGVFPDAQGDNFLLQLMSTTSESEGITGTKAFIYGQRGASIAKDIGLAIGVGKGLFKREKKAKPIGFDEVKKGVKFFKRVKQIFSKGK